MQHPIAGLKRKEPNRLDELPFNFSSHDRFGRYDIQIQIFMSGNDQEGKTLHLPYPPVKAIGKWFQNSFPPNMNNAVK